MKIIVGVNVGVDEARCSETALGHVRSQPWPKGSRVTTVSAAMPRVVVDSEADAAAAAVARKKRPS